MLRGDQTEDSPQVLFKKIPQRKVPGFVADRMLDLLLSDKKEVREHTCMALTVMAGFAAGCEMLVTNTTFLENLAAVIEDDYAAVRMKAATLLEMVVSNWMGTIIQ